ncbi:MAG: hypothetical protein LBT44_02820, partial [Clostridiales bacterium]|nr:hypothetical protein [Clostridiales bacterium]
MVWDSIPNFDDENAKISESVHELSGCRRFDVLYGGRDSLTGASISPKSKADGHGHFILLEVDGELHPFSDRNPVSTGGQHEFGTDR